MNTTPPTTAPAGSELADVTLADLHAANIVRQAEWCPDQVPDLSFRGNELGGECGEAQNVIKKLERERLGWRGSRATLDDLAQELADVVICADLCAVTAGIDLGAAVVAKFNATSEKVGLATRLPASPLAPLSEQAGAERVDLGELERLSKAATQGIWGVERGHSDDALWLGEMRPDGEKVEHIIFSQTGLNDYRASYRNKCLADAAYIVALVNAHRSGNLVPASLAPASEAGNGWRPISTAPKDGTDVLLYAEAWDWTWGIQIGRFEQGQWFTAEGSVDENEDGFDPNAEVGEDFDPDEITNVGPTHWMPVPRRPSSLPKAPLPDQAAVLRETGEGR